MTPAQDRRDDYAYRARVEDAHDDWLAPVVDLGWIVSVNEVEGPMVDEVAGMVRRELDAMVARLAAQGLPGVQVSRS